MKSVLSSTKARLTSLGRLIRKRKILTVFLALLLLFIIDFSYTYWKDEQALKNQNNQFQSMQSNSLYVVNVVPNNKIALPEKITIAMSDVVDLHAFEHSFQISGDIAGKFQYGKNKRIIEFIPHEPFKEGITVYYYISEGLVSTSHKVLHQGFSGEFNTSPLGSDVQFIKEGVAGRVLSHAGQSPLSLEIAKSTKLVSADISLYRSTQAHLLNYLVYRHEENEYEDTPLYSGQYIQHSVEHPSADKIESFTIRKTEKKQFNLKPGVYYIEAKINEKVISSSFIVVNTIGTIVRQDDKQIVLTNIDLSTNTLLDAQASFGLYNLKNTPNQLAVHTFNSFEKTYPFALSKGLDAIVGTINNETIFIPLRLPQSQADIQASDLDAAHQLFFFTDRPIYKPGDTVKVSGVVRIDSDGIYKKAPSGTSVRLWIGGEINPETEFYAQTNEQGIFSGEFVLSKDSKPDTKYLLAQVQGSKRNTRSASTFFDVVEYVKPEFELTTSVAKPEYLSSDTVKFKVKGSYFNGKALANTEIQYDVFANTYYEVEQAVYNSNFNINSVGGMCGGGISGPWDEYYGTALETNAKATLDNNGEAIIEYTLPKDLLGSQQITLIAKKTTPQNEIVSAVNTIVHAGEYALFFIPSAQTYKSNEQVVAPFYAEDLKGNKITHKKFSYSLENTDISGSATTDASGVGIISFQLPDQSESTGSTIVLQGTDSGGRNIQASKYVYIYGNTDSQRPSYSSNDSIDQLYLKIVSTKNNFLVGDTIELVVTSPKELDALVTLERGRVYSPQIIRLFPGKNTVRFPVTSEMSPSTTVVFSFFAEGRYHSEGLAFNVPAMHKLLQVEVSTDKTRYVPNEQAKLTIKTKDSLGNPVPANIMINIVDKAIYALRKSASPPIHSSFYYFRPRSTNASSSLTFVGVYPLGGMGGGGGGDASMGNNADTLYWNPNLVTNSEGVAEVQVPLRGIQTTWKASVIGVTEQTDVGQSDTEFIVSDEVLGATTPKQKKK